ncbi:cytochrome P450 [Crassisporium funariophilum]|nr:cytochrome P450 [Crassisporium funariophilum]
MQGFPLLFLTCGLLYFGRKLIDFVNAIRSIQNLPGYRTVFSNQSVLAFLLPRVQGFCPGSNHFFEDKHSTFRAAGWDITSTVSAFPQALTTIVLADAAAIKEVTSARARFPKPVEQYSSLTFFGRNIVASEGEEWKKYRKISAPAFSDRNNKLVWDETVKIMDGLFNDLWAGRDVISVDHAVDITLPIALFVIGVAGFGKQISWRDEAAIPAGHTMSYKDALHVVSTDIFLKVFVPDWALGLTKRLRTVKTAFEELQAYMSEMIQERQSSDKVERHDLFSSLLDANNHDLDATSLAESELIGNIFIFLLAGHETTAHTLCFTFAMLALYPDEQEKLYKHIKSVLTDGRVPTYEDMPLLEYSEAVFYETLRMFPPVVNIPKISAEDTTLSTVNGNGEKLVVPISKGTRITIDTPGLHFNPRYWEDPHVFKPERFLADWPRDAFVPFSAGARACLGRKFFETEGIAVLTMLISRYKITIKEEQRFSGETFEQTKERVLRSRNALTLTPLRVPLTFTLRD